MPTPVLPVGAAPLSPETSVDEVDRVLDQVELALSRLDDGTYGQCATCGSAIDDAHLADNPMARALSAVRDRGEHSRIVAGSGRARGLPVDPASTGRNR